MRTESSDVRHHLERSRYGGDYASACSAELHEHLDDAFLCSVQRDGAVGEYARSCAEDGIVQLGERRVGRQNCAVALALAGNEIANFLDRLRYTLRTVGQ